MKKIILGVLMCVASIGFCGCGQHNEEVEAEAQVIVDAFTDDDMEDINEIIFGTEEIEVDSALSDVWGENTQSQNGALSCIFDLVTINVKSSTDSTIEFEIEAPDMSKVFMDIDTSAENISENELLDYIENYAKNVELRETTVSLEYSDTGEELVIDYQNEEFINAVTGGLLEAYETLYTDMLEEYTEGGNES